MSDETSITLEQQLARKIETTRGYNERHGNGGFFDKPVSLSVSEAEALHAEIERLTAALATAEAARDAARMDRDLQTQRLDVALAVIKLDIDNGEVITNKIASICRTGEDEMEDGYLVSSESGELEYDPAYFVDAWASYVRNSQAAPQPTAAPAVDAAPVGDDVSHHAKEAVEYLYSAQGLWGDMQADVTGNWAHHMMLAFEALMKHVGIDTEGETR